MEQAAFRSFYQETAPALRSYIARACGSMDAADDILQEVFMRFLAKAPSDLSEPEMRGYLYRTAESLIIDRWRSSKRERARDLLAQAERREIVSPWDGDDVHRALSQLKPQQRTLLWLAYVEEFDHREIAAAAGITERSVRVLLFRARKTLAKVLTLAGLGPEAANAK
jgi:RNA polymerase sigma-70 factor, ECF subfamily